MKVRELLRGKGRDVVTAKPDEAIWSVLRRFQVNRIGALVVLDDDGRLLGVLSERDLVTGLISKGQSLVGSPVREVMSTSVPTCDLDDGVGEIMQRMTDRRTRHLPVVDDGELVGLISIGDVVKAVLDDAEMEVKVLRDIARARR